MKRGHIPARMCIGCRQVRPKENLLRIVTTSDGGGLLDPTCHSPGRGSYLCPSSECFGKATKNGRFASYSNNQDLKHIISSGIHAANSEDDLKGC